MSTGELKTLAIRVLPPENSAISNLKPEESPLESTIRTVGLWGDMWPDWA